MNASFLVHNAHSFFEHSRQIDLVQTIQGYLVFLLSHGGRVLHVFLTSKTS